MAEYIERETLIAHIKDLPTWWADDGGVYGRSMKYPEGMFDCADVVSSVENAPAVDVAPVVHGRWVRKGSNWYCTGCDKGYRISCGSPPANTFDYCPNCGAKMDGGAE